MKPLTCEAWVKDKGQIAEVYVSGNAPGFTRAGDGDEWYKISLQRFNYLVYENLVNNYRAIRGGFEVELDEEAIRYYRSTLGLTPEMLIYLFDTAYDKHITIERGHMWSVDRGDDVLACSLYGIDTLMDEGSVSLLVYSVHSERTRRLITSKCPSDMYKAIHVINPNLLLITLNAERIMTLRESLAPTKLLFSHELFDHLLVNPTAFAEASDYTSTDIKEAVERVLNYCSAHI